MDNLLAFELHRQLGTQPPSCGPISSHEYLRFKIYMCQAWRYAPKIDLPPSKPWVKPELGEHKTPPRVKDRVIHSSKGVGVICGYDRDVDSFIVFYFGLKEYDSHALDEFVTNRGRIRWQIL